jgi:pimeloyl-ACP methyl ester carboxylesterase
MSNDLIKDNPRAYGSPPFRVAVVHGGPGACGEMAPVARELSLSRGVLEPLLTAGSVGGQIEELKGMREGGGAFPVTLIGFSWGAWLAVLFAARYPALARKLILVGSGGFEERSGARTMETRMRRLSGDERKESASLMEVSEKAPGGDGISAIARLGAIFAWADAYDPIEEEPSEPVDFRADVYRAVWGEAAALRKSGALMESVKQIACPVAEIHGDYDPHPSEDVRIPLSGVLGDFRFILLEHCGHKPWIERRAKDEFYRVLNEEVIS